MTERQPDPSASTTQFRAFIDKGGSESDRGPMLSTSSIALIVGAVILVVLGVIAVATM